MMWSHMSISSPRSCCRWTRCLARFATRNTGFSRIQIRWFPEVAQRYSPEIIRELLHNAIAHQDYRLSGKINLLEYEDRLVFMNEGSFIPGSIDAALAVGYKPPYYRNSLLAKAMSKVGMIDQNAIGIRNVFEMQRKRRRRCPHTICRIALAYRSRSMEPSSMRNIRNYLRPSRIWICRVWYGST